MTQALRKFSRISLGLHLELFPKILLQIFVMDFPDEDSLRLSPQLMLSP